MTTSEMTPTWLPADEFMLRIAGLPVEVAARLRTPDTVAWADAMIDTRATLQREGAELSDLLHQHIHDRATDTDRGALVSLRRVVFNGRLPRDFEATRALAATCPGPLAARLAAWLDARTELESLSGRGAPTAAAELATGRRALAAAAAADRFRHGLLLASPTLDASLDTYLTAAAEATGPLPKRRRRVERSLLDYVYRVACKTSPFSSFTGVALGTVGGPADAGVLAGTIDDTWTGAVRVNVAIIGRLIDALAADEARLAVLHIAASPGLSADPERVRFVRRHVVRGDDSATVAFDTVRDSTLYLRRNDALRHVLDLLDAASPLSFGELVDGLAAALDTDDRGPCADYVQALLRLGLLWLPELQIDVHAPDPLTAFASALDRLTGRGLAWAARPASRVRALAERAADYPTSDLAGRRTVLGGLRAELAELFAELGRADETLPITLLFEDTRCATGAVQVDATTWADQVMTPLQRVAEALPAFDVSLAPKLLLKGFFVARYGAGGRCDDVLSLVHEFVEDIYDEYGRVAAKRAPFDAEGNPTPHDNWLGLPAVDAVNAARTHVVETMRELVAAAPDEAEEVQLPDALLERGAELLRPLENEVRPQGFFLQLAGEPTDPQVIVNGTTSGTGFSFSRFTHLFADLGLADRVRDALQSRTPRDAVLADLVGGLHHTNLNVHAPLTAHHLVCPAEASSFPVDAQLPLDDLLVEHDETEDRLVLRSRRLGREVVPLYHGYLLPTALPEIARVLLLFSPMGLALADFWAGVPEAAAVDGVTVRPRLRYRNVVLTRRRWSAPAPGLPQRDPADDDAAWLVRWRDWQRAHGLPDQVFATFPAEPRVDGDDSAAAEDEDATSGEGRRSKPQYVDFTSLFSLGVLDTALRRTDNRPGARIDFEEMRPTEEQLYVRSAHGHHVTELAVETTRVPAPHPTGAPR